MSEAALSRIAHLIKLEDDLVKIPTLRQQFSKEKASMDLKLNTTVQQQIDTITSNMYKLNKSADSLNGIKSSLNKIDSVYEDSITSIPDYDMIRKVTSLNQYMIQTESLTRDIKNFKSFIGEIEELIENEMSIVSEHITYPLDNIFLIHYKLNQARNLHDFLRLPNNKFTDDLESIIGRILYPLSQAVKHFDELLVEIIISLTEAVKEGNHTMALKLVKILEYENKEDLKIALKEKLAMTTNTQGNKSNGVSKWGTIDEDELISGLDVDAVTTNYSQFRGVRRNYMKFFYDKFQESLEETFDKCVEHFAEDKMLVYDNLGWLEEELIFVGELLISIFPPYWDINGFVQGVYYNKLHRFTMDLIKTEPTAEELLRILAYDKHYSQFIAALPSTSMKEKGAVSLIGEDLKKVVLDDYLKVIISKMDEWNENLISQETYTFLNREEPPDYYVYRQTIEDEDIHDQTISIEIDGNVFVLPDFKTAMSMLKEQADVAADSGYGSILVGVIENWSRCHIKRTMNYRMLINDEFEKYMSVYNNDKFIELTSSRMKFFKRNKNNEAQFDIENMTAEELAQISKPGLIEYLTALGNTFEINSDRLQEKFLPTYRGKVHASYQQRIQDAFEDTTGPLYELNAQVIRNIIDIITNDLYPALSNVFTKEWYDDQKRQAENQPNMAEQVLETVVEYMQELRGYASYDIYLTTFALLLDSFITSYIRIGYQNILHGKAKKIDPTATKKFKSFGEAIGRDVTIFYGGLESLFTRRDVSYLLNSLRAIEFLGELATCENPMIAIPDLWEHEILNTFHYCSVEYVRGICLCRKDMDKVQVNELIGKLEIIKAEFHNNVPQLQQVIGTLNDFYYN